MFSPLSSIYNRFVSFYFGSQPLSRSKKQQQLDALAAQQNQIEALAQRIHDYFDLSEFTVDSTESPAKFFKTQGLQLEQIRNRMLSQRRIRKISVINLPSSEDLSNEIKQLKRVRGEILAARVSHVQSLAKKIQTLLLSQTAEGAKHYSLPSVLTEKENVECGMKCQSLYSSYDHFIAMLVVIVAVIILGFIIVDFALSAVMGSVLIATGGFLAGVLAQHNHEETLNAELVKYERSMLCLAHEISIRG